MTRYFYRNRKAYPLLWRDDGGLTTVEYAVISALVGVGLITAITAIGSAVNAEWSRTETALNAPPGTHSGAGGTNTGGTGTGGTNTGGKGSGKAK